MEEMRELVRELRAADLPAEVQGFLFPAAPHPAPLRHPRDLDREQLGEVYAERFDLRARERHPSSPPSMGSSCSIVGVSGVDRGRGERIAAAHSGQRLTGLPFHKPT